MESGAGSHAGSVEKQHWINQIAQKAHVLNVVDAKRYDEDSKRLDKLIREVTAAVVLPAKRE